MLFFLLICLFISSYGGQLTKPQLIQIKNILTNPKTPPEIKNATQNVLIKHHQLWLHSKVHKFAKNNKFSSAFKHELAESAQIGLLKSFKYYNASMPLYKYADKYLFYEFTKSITRQMPMGYLNHYERYIKKVNVSYPTFIGDDNYLNYYKPEKYSGPIFLITNDDRVLEKDKIKSHLNNLISELSLFEKRLFYYRYDINTFDVKYNVEQVCELMCIHRETYRTTMKKIEKHLKKNLYKSL